MRTAAVVCFALVPVWALAGCGGAQTRGAERQEELLEGAGRVVLWCEEPAGEACGAAAELLDVSPQPSGTVPEWLLSPILDGEDDCAPEGMAVVLGEVASALGIQPSNWHDNAGARVSRDDLGQTFAGGGCTNCCWDEREPPVKVHAVAADGGGHRYLVRVWERQRPEFSEDEPPTE